MTDTFPNSITRHGTHSGWSKHTKAGERPCDPCFFAKKEYDARRLAAPEKTRLNRLRASAQNKAHTALSRKYRGEYLTFYTEFVQELAEQHGIEIQTKGNA